MYANLQARIIGALDAEELERNVMNGRNLSHMLEILFRKSLRKD